MEIQKQLILLDGHALAYRAYFATQRNGLTNRSGQPTGAIFGFLLYLMRIITKYPHAHKAVVFDSAKPTFRHEMYADYKANRVAMPDELISQFPIIFQLVNAFCIPVIKQDGLEADDILAHLALDAAKNGYMVSLVTRDKDLMQLVSGSIRMLAPQSGGEFEEFGPDEVLLKMGVGPEKIRDLLALMGDASDNIPGVPSVGEKTAVKILTKAGSIEALLKDVTILENKKLEATISANIDRLILSRDLATLKTDIELPICVNELVPQKLNAVACSHLFKELEFTSFLKNPLFATTKSMNFESIIVTTFAQVHEIADAITTAGFVSIDTETTSIHPREAQLVGISLAINEQKAYYLPLGHAAPLDTVANLNINDVLDILRVVLESDGIKKVGQNLKYDYQVFKNYGVVFRGISFDTMIAAYLVDPGKRQYGLEALATDYLELKTTPIEDLIGKGAKQKSFAEVPVADAAYYSGEDVILPLMLQTILLPRLKEQNCLALFNEMEIPLVSILAEMEWAGVALDCKLLSIMEADMSGKLLAISEEIYALAGETFNLNSPKQISEVFFEHLKMPKSKKTKTGLSTDVDALEKLAEEYPVAQKLLSHREYQKLLSTYIVALPQQVSSISGRLHTSFNQTIAATGRLSSTSPNLQNIPIRTDEGRKIRGAFIASPGTVIVAADYSQIELRILAHVSQDTTLVLAFQNDQDIHEQTASVIYGVFPGMVTPQMRRVAKTINFGLMYGMGPHNLARQLSISFKEAQGFIDTYFAQFPKIHASMDTAIAKARSAGYAQTLLDRRRYVPEINSENRQVRESTERIAINTPIQGTAADIIKIAMINIARELPQMFPSANMLLQVHDELVFEVPTDSAEQFSKWACEKMSGAYTLSVPLKVEAGIGPSWSEAH
jgi:DNA polymerase-1